MILKGAIWRRVTLHNLSSYFDGCDSPDCGVISFRLSLVDALTNRLISLAGTLAGAVKSFEYCFIK
jgi:hypothetical protein